MIRIFVNIISKCADMCVDACVGGCEKQKHTWQHMFNQNESWF